MSELTFVVIDEMANFDEETMAVLDKLAREQLDNSWVRTNYLPVNEIVVPIKKPEAP